MGNSGTLRDNSTMYIKRAFFIPLLILLILPYHVHAISNEKITEEVSAFYNKDVNYAQTVARITDRDASGTVFKIRGEDPNLKFLRSGDKISFHMPGKNKKEQCVAYVRSSEFDYIIIFVKDYQQCWKHDGKIRLGTILKIYSDDLSSRVSGASLHRVTLLKKKEDFIIQLKELNNFIWAYNAKRVQVAANFDKKILDIQKAKAKALSFVSLKKKSSLILQDELAFKLDEVDKELEFYRVEKREFYSDRWFMDHDLGKPVNKRPQDLKKRDELETMF